MSELESEAENPALRQAAAHLRRLEPYVPGLQPQGGDWIKLNTNENPFPASPLVGQAIQGEVDRLRLYPSPDSRSLRDAAARLHGLDGKQVFAANGSDEVYALMMRIYGGGEVPYAWMDPSYSLYPVLAAAHAGGFRAVPFDRTMRFDPERVSETIAGTRLFILTSPNAPTGTGFSNEAIQYVADHYEGLVVVDEAYADFAEENAVPLLSLCPNLMITRTLSKSYALAGLRVGYALAAPEVIGLIDQVRDSYNLDRLAQVGAVAALEDQGYHRAIVGKIKRVRDYQRAIFERRGWFTYRSAANFLFTEPRDGAGRTGPDVAHSLFKYLYGHRILVRYFPAHPLTRAFLRISIGDEEQMELLTEAIEQWEATTHNAPPA